MALTNLAVFGGAFFTPIVVGKITDTIGWRWSFHFVTIFTGICLPLVFFFVPETAFRRSAHLNTDMASTDKLQLPQKSEETGHGIHVFNGEGEPVTPPTPPTPPVNATDATSIPDPESHTAVQDFSAASIPEKSLSAKLALFSGRINDENYFKLFLRPFPLFAHPGILWACLIQGSTIGWTVFIGVILAAIFIGPPLYWDVVTTGYAYAGAFIGAVAGFAIAGAVADWSTKYMTRRNKGIFEPEFRIVLVIPQFVFGCTGLYLFGITTTALTKYSWAVPIFAFGLEVCGMVIGAVATSLYIVDAHRGLLAPIVYQSF
jgi:MFS family permease